MQVDLAKRSLKLTVAATVAAITVMSSANASTTAPARPAAQAATAHGAASPTKAPKSTKTPKVLAPGGCNNYNFCEYNAGNGGDLCFQTRQNSSTWPSACAYHNEGEYNRGSSAVKMWSAPGYKGCYYLLYSGHYLLYNENDKFQGPSGCTNTELEHNLTSSDFV